MIKVLPGSINDKGFGKYEKRGNPETKTLSEFPLESSRYFLNEEEVMVGFMTEKVLGKGSRRPH